MEQIKSIFINKRVYNMNEKIQNFIIKSNRFVLWLLSGLVTLTGAIQLNNYDIDTIEFLFISIVTLIAYNYMVRNSEMMDN